MRSKRSSGPRRPAAKPRAAKGAGRASADGRLKSAVALAQKGKLPQALKATERILANHPEHWQTMNFAATLLARVGQTDAALALARRAIAHAPDDAEIRRRLTMDFTAFAGQHARPDEAIAVCREYLDRYGPSADVLASLSAVQISALKMSDGLRTVDEGIARFPDNPTLHHNRSVALFHLGRFEESIEAFGRVLRPLEGGNGDTSAEVVAQYARLAESYDDNRLHQLYGRQMADLIVKTVGTTAAKRALDAGCGTGALGTEIRAARLVGIDISPAMLAKARARNVYHELVEGDLVAEMSRRTDLFDIIASAVVLYHIADLAPFFREAARLIVPSGHLFLSVDPAPDSMEIGVSQPGEYAHSRRYLRRLATETNFAEVAVKFLPHRGNPGFWCAFRRA